MNVIISLSNYDMSGKITSNGITERVSYSHGAVKYSAANLRKLGLSNSKVIELMETSRLSRVNAIKSAIDEFGYMSEGHYKAIAETPLIYTYEI